MRFRWQGGRPAAGAPGSDHPRFADRRPRHAHDRLRPGRQALPRRSVRAATSAPSRTSAAPRSASTTPMAAAGGSTRAACATRSASSGDRARTSSGRPTTGATASATTSRPRRSIWCATATTSAGPTATTGGSATRSSGSSGSCASDRKPGVRDAGPLRAARPGFLHRPRLPSRLQRRSLRRLPRLLESHHTDRLQDRAGPLPEWPADRPDRRFHHRLARRTGAAPPGVARSMSSSARRAALYICDDALGVVYRISYGR